MDPDLEDPDGFAALYDRHARDVLVFLARRTFDAELALELMAETFAQAWRGRRRFRGSTEEEARGWLFGIARNQLGHYLRRGRAERRALRRLGLEPPAAGEDALRRIEELAGVAELRGLVASELRRLSEGQRAALELRVVRELSYPEVARRLAISEDTARARVSRGLRALAAAIEARAQEAGG